LGKPEHWTPIQLNLALVGVYILLGDYVWAVSFLLLVEVEDDPFPDRSYNRVLRGFFWGEISSSIDIIATLCELILYAVSVM